MFLFSLFVCFLFNSEDGLAQGHPEESYFMLHLMLDTPLSPFLSPAPSSLARRTPRLEGTEEVSSKSQKPPDFLIYSEPNQCLKVLH